MVSCGMNRQSTTARTPSPEIYDHNNHHEHVMREAYRIGRGSSSGSNSGRHDQTMAASTFKNSKRASPSSFTDSVSNAKLPYHHHHHCKHSALDPLHHNHDDDDDRLMMHDVIEVMMCSLTCPSSINLTR